MRSRTLTPETLDEGLAVVTARDGALASLLERLGPPPLWSREPGFATLVHIILEQQVSIASARAAFDRLLDRLDEPTPTAFLALDDDCLREIGFSRQKRGYARGLARAIAAGELDLAALAGVGDEEVRTRLTALRGIGPWSAEVYLLMALRRADAWPVGDLALAVAVGEIQGLAARPDRDELVARGERYRPWRAVATFLYWHHYLESPRR